MYYPDNAPTRLKIEIDSLSSINVIFNRSSLSTKAGKPEYKDRGPAPISFPFFALNTYS